MADKVLLAWSGGKDCAITLYEIQQRPEYQVASLLTTLTADYDRVSMHGVRRTLLQRQAESLSLPLHEVFSSKEATNEEYVSKMQAALIDFQKVGVSSVVFGDIHLADVRKYREDNLSKVGMKAIFPIWGRDTAELTRSFIDLGFKAIVTCVDSKVLDKTFAGRIIDKSFLAQLPANVDPCGENGEFHSFVFDGPIFNGRIQYILGQIVLRDSFWFCDLIPA